MKNKNCKKIILFVGLWLGLAFCSSNNVWAYTASITTSNNVVVDVSPAGEGVSIQGESINVTSDCRSGYTLAIATSENSDLYEDGDSTNPVAFTAVDGVSALNSSNNINKWGYTLASNPTGSTVFSPLSTNAISVKTPVETASPSSDIDDTFSINYGVKAGGATTAGSYQMANSGVITYYLAMDVTCTSYIVAFNANGGTGTMANQVIHEGRAVELEAETFTAPEGASYTDADNNTINGDANKIWIFWGWNTMADGTGDWYKDKETVEDLESINNTLTLYAQWKQATLADMTAGTPVGTEKVVSHNLMQDMRPEICYNSEITTAANAPAATLLDYRGKVTIGENPESPEQYTVSKLPDGLCWMTTNLNLGRNDSAGPNNDGTITLTSEDTDLADGTTFILPKSTTTSNADNTAAVIRTTNTSGNNNNGTYYSWPAAVANTGSIGANVSVTTSVCPKNWDLPGSNRYTNLFAKADYKTGNLTTDAPSSFLINGGFTNGSSFYQTSYSHFWTNVSGGATAAYGARVNGTTMTTSSTTGTTYGGNKYYRKNIRCVASQGTATINYDGNGTAEYPVTGSVATQENVEVASAVAQSGAGFNREKWTFDGWNTERDGSGTSVAVSSSLAILDFKPGDTITLYAQWKPQQQIVYNDNCSYDNTGCASGTDATGTSNWTTAGSNITLGSRTYFTTKNNYYIASWNTERDGSGTSYSIGGSYTVPAALAEPNQVVLYAQWLPQYVITYVNNCASYISDNANCAQVSNNTGTDKVDLDVSGNGSTTLKSYNFLSWVLTGWEIIGWNTAADGTGAEYAVSSIYSVSGQGADSGITLYAHWVRRYSIQYDGNGASNPNGMGTTDGDGIKSVKQINVAENNPVTLLVPNFKRAGYGFAGWSVDPDAWAHFTDNDSENDPIIYGPIETMKAPAYSATTDGILTLYAVWASAEKDANDNPVYLQDFGTTECSNLTSVTFDSTTGTIMAGSVIALTDKRDNEVYTVARLADGNCWLVENLRLEHEGTIGNNINDSTVTNASLAQGYYSHPGSGTNYGNFVGLAEAETSTFNSTIVANSIYYANSQSGTATEGIGSSNAGYRFPRYNHTNTGSLIDSTSLSEDYSNASAPATNANYSSLSIYSYGNYYTWAAAMASTKEFTTSSSDSANTSICPFGWVLPTGASASSDFGVLSQRYDGTGGSQSDSAGSMMSNRFRAFPNNFLLSGRYSSSSAGSRGITGEYWSRTARGSTYASIFSLGSNKLNPADNTNTYNYKYMGHSVRCLVYGSQ